MIQFGKLIAFKVEKNAIVIEFEKQEGRVEIITDRIINIFAGLINDSHRSKAIEGEKAVYTEFTVEREKDCICIRTSFVTVRVYDEFKVDFYDKNGNILCRDYRKERVGGKALGEEEKKLLAGEGHSVDEKAYVPVEIVKVMEGSECFYGLGDKTGYLNKRNYEYVMWNTDNPDPQVDCFKALYKTIPFFITLKEEGVFGLFFDNSYKSYMDMGKESNDYYWFGAEGGNLDYYLIGADTMPDVLKGYAYLTGTVPLPQIWTLGYQQSRWGYITEEDVRGIAQKFRQHDIPCDAIHLDIDYMDAYKVFTWNRDNYRNPKKAIEELRNDGFKIVTIIDPGVKAEEGYEIYETGVKHSYFAKTPEGEVYKNRVWPGITAYPDFGNPAVREWWADNQKFLMDMGVSGVWNDMNEPASFDGELPPDVVFTDEEQIADHARMHNLYGHNMAKATYEGVKKHSGKRPFLITRACYAGSQKYTTAWTGDNHSIWPHLQMLIPQLSNLSLSGMSFVGTDVGGFGSDVTPELLIRWVEAGCFSPLFRNHSAMGTRNQEPWQFDEDTLRIYRSYVKLRYRLIPYYYDLFFEGEKTGMPILRPLVLHYETDSEVKNMNTEFLIGESLLAAPVVEQGSTMKTVYLPEGVWYDYWTKEAVEGGRYLLRDAPLDLCPLYVKAGSILPNFLDQSYVGEKETDTLILDVYPSKSNDTVYYDHYQDNGMDFAYRDGGYNQYRIAAESDGTVKISRKHHGYEKTYKKAVVQCLFQRWETEIEE